ncbi:MAG: C10 family peptidase, partial [Bacteroidales bacterium]
SAIDEIHPIIGYSIENEYNQNNQPEHYISFLQGYADKINYVRENQIPASNETIAAWEYFLSDDFQAFEMIMMKDMLAPLVSCQWDQGYPYNVMCPAATGGPGGYVYAGCVATAMSQVMYYWRYPLQGIGSHSYWYGQYGNISANFGATEYDWDAMENSINHENPWPIAELQFHCGVAVEMMYGPNGSGAYSSDVPPALEDYFGYSDDAVYRWKEDYSNADWIEMLKGNLDNGWPMYYSGYSSAGGHAFVCDGYQDDFFHFNFGWGGSSDGYYSLNDVNGFHDGQGCVFNTYPGSNYPYFCAGDKVYTAKSGTIEDGSGPVADYENNNACTWLIDPQTAEDSISSIKLTFSKFDLDLSDQLVIYDGSTTSDEILATLTGSDIPEAVMSTGNKMLIQFNTDNAATANGWLASFTSVVPDFCKGVTVLTEPADVFSDGSGTFNYQNSKVCMWQIIPEFTESITLEFTSFNTEAGMDKVKVFDYETQELLAEYSGQYLTSLPEPVTCYSGKMFVTFNTSGSTSYDGWSAIYYSVPVSTPEVGEDVHQLAVYPNPAKEILNIEIQSAEAEPAEIQLQGLDGRIVYQGIIELNPTKINQHINVTEFNSGMYILIVRGEDLLYRKKIVIE